MLSPLSQDSLDGDADTLVFEPRRHRVRIYGKRVPSLLNRCGVERRMWDHLARTWVVPVRYLPALLARAEKDRRNVLIEDHPEDDVR